MTTAAEEQLLAVFKNEEFRAAMLSVDPDEATYKRFSELVANLPDDWEVRLPGMLTLEFKTKKVTVMPNRIRVERKYLASERAKQYEEAQD